jgi:hypothetical protein
MWASGQRGRRGAYGRGGADAYAILLLAQLAQRVAQMESKPPVTLGLMAGAPRGLQRHAALSDAPRAGAWRGRGDTDAARAPRRPAAPRLALRPTPLPPPPLVSPPSPPPPPPSPPPPQPTSQCFSATRCRRRYGRSSPIPTALACSRAPCCRRGPARGPRGPSRGSRGRAWGAACGGGGALMRGSGPQPPAHPVACAASNTIPTGRPVVEDLLERLGARRRVPPVRPPGRGAACAACAAGAPARRAAALRAPPSEPGPRPHTPVPPAPLNPPNPPSTPSLPPKAITTSPACCGRARASRRASAPRASPR